MLVATAGDATPASGFERWRARLVNWAIAANVRATRLVHGRRTARAAPAGGDAFTVGAVIVSRDDDYGGHLRERAAHALGSAAATFDKVLYVDWASPAADLVRAIGDRLPASRALALIRVAPDHAARLVRHDPDAQRCCEVLGRNIGIRRLVDQGFDYVVSANVDIVFPGRERLHAFVRERLAPHRLVTVARRDVPLADVRRLAGGDPLAVSRALQERGDAYPPQPPFAADPFSLVTACGDFQIAPRHVWEVIRGFEERLIYRMFADTGVQAKALAAGFEVRSDATLPVFHIAHGAGGGGSGRRNRRWRMVPPLRITANPATWGCAADPALREIGVG